MPNPIEMAVNREYDQRGYFDRVWDFISGSSQKLTSEIETIIDGLDQDRKDLADWMEDQWDQSFASDGDQTGPPVTTQGNAFGAMLRSDPKVPALIGLGAIGVAFLLLRK